MRNCTTQSKLREGVWRRGTKSPGTCQTREVGGQRSDGNHLVAVTFTLISRLQPHGILRKTVRQPSTKMMVISINESAKRGYDEIQFDLASDQ